ncbi:hypothetical protein [Halobiforma nitratireducens]|nr:hypothetical protein [Halobiforma nitratireducens]
MTGERSDSEAEGDEEMNESVDTDKRVERADNDTRHLEGNNERAGQNPKSRRTVLQSLTVGAVGITGIGGMTGPVTADSPENDIENEILEGPEAKKAAAAARRTEAYRDLRKIVQESGNKLRPNEVFAGRSSDGETIRTVVSFEVDIKSEEFDAYDEGHVTIAVETEDRDDGTPKHGESVVLSELEYVERDDDDAPTEALIIVLC